MLVPAINKIILGTAQFGLEYGINNTTGKPTQQAVNEILCKAYDAGIRCLDTAEAYGNAHEVIGRFHQDYPDRIFNVISKLPHDIDNNIRQNIEKYLRQLNIDRLEALLFHSYQTYKAYKKAKVELHTYKNNNTVKYLGVSVYTNDQFADVIEDDEIDIVQLPFNLFDNINQRGALLAKAKQKNKIVHTRSVFLQGLFFSMADDQSKIARSLSRELNYIKDLSHQSAISVQKMALNYCLQNVDNDNVLIGVDNLDQLEQNLKDADNNLSAALIDKINKIHITDIDLLNPSLWRQ